MSIEQLAETAQAMVAAGKGIIAIDESNATIAKRFAGVGIENTEENRRAYREMLLTTPKLGDYISGAILYDETLRQSTKSGVPFTKVMMDNGIIPGIKVDKGPQPLAGFQGEVVTEGLDGLRARLEEYYKLGARFAKWRAVINIGDDIPSGTCIEANAHALARYAALCQEQGIVPMVEPEVLMDGDHDIQTCYEVTEVDAAFAVRRAVQPERHARRHHPQGLDDRAGQGQRRARVGRRRRREHPDVPEDRRAGDPAGHRVPLRRPERRGRHRAPRRDEPHGPEPVAAVVLLRPRDAVGRAEDLVAGPGQQRRARRRRPSSPAPATTAWPRWASGSRRPRNSRVCSPPLRAGEGWGGVTAAKPPSPSDRHAAPPSADPPHPSPRRSPSSTR